MAEKRKDKKGRILKTGESQRKDDSYQFRYKDDIGKYRYVYADTLSKLREKEESIQRSISLGLITAVNDLTVYDLVRQYLATKNSIRFSTSANYNSVLKYLESDPFGKVKVQDVKVSDAKRWFVNLQEIKGKGYGCIATIRSVVKPAFQMAYEDDIIKKNPFIFNLSSVIENDMNKREAVDMAVISDFLDFVKNDGVCSKYFDEIVLLLETGLRVSEFCGLTRNDIDFEHRKIRVRRQLVKKNNGEWYISLPKTKSGMRDVPMTDVAFNCLQRVLNRSNKNSKNLTVDGFSDFVFLNRNGNPLIRQDIDKYIRCAAKRFKIKNPDYALPRITPHILRHTFCTNLANKGINIQNLSYLMGHSNSNVTLGIYTHSSYSEAEKDMRLAISK